MTTPAASVDRMLDRYGLGRAAPGSITRLFGRNENYAVRTQAGRDLVVKRLLGGSHEDRVQRSTSYERHRRCFADPRLPQAPDSVVADAEAGVLIFDQLQHAASGTEQMVDQVSSTTTAREIGVAVAALHRSPGATVPAGPPRTPPPDPELLEGLPLAHVHRSSGAELQAWSLLQEDHQLGAALRDLVESSRSVTAVPIHGDLRVDQVLVTAGPTYIVDWEEFRLDDPARDIGSFAGEWLYRAVLDIPTRRGDDAEWTGTPSSASVAERGAAKLRTQRGIVEAFWAGYASVIPSAATDVALVERAAAFAGWHLIDRLFAGAAVASHLAAIQRAAAGVGRTAVLRPDLAAASIGLAA